MANLGPSCTEQELIQVFSRLVLFQFFFSPVLGTFNGKVSQFDVYFFSIFLNRFPGFLKLKMQSTYGAPVAFVDFEVLGSFVCGSSFS